MQYSDYFIQALFPLFHCHATLGKLSNVLDYIKKISQRGVYLFLPIACTAQDFGAPNLNGFLFMS
jgi:hypothetical protein